MAELSRGYRCGRLVALEPIGLGRSWSCICDCGEITEVRKNALLSGRRQSCGCRKRVKPQGYTCKICNETKQREEFYIRTNGNLFHKECRECYKEKQRERERTKRLKALHHYSGGTPKCVCCPEDTIEFLQLDHGNNDGAAHRKETGIGTKLSIWKWLEKNNYPDNLGLQVLCANCNLAKAYYGVCPHQRP